MKREKNPNQTMPVFVRKPAKPAKKAEEPVPEIDTKKAVAFAMSIAMEMKQRQKAADDARKEESSTVFNHDGKRYSSFDLHNFLDRLMAEREGLIKHTSSMKDTASLNDSDDVEPDGADGTSQTMRVDTINRIESAHRSINEIDQAIRRVNDGSYGVCMTCGRLISKERLLHSPFAMNCTSCQQKIEAAV